MDCARMHNGPNSDIDFSSMEKSVDFSTTQPVVELVEWRTVESEV